jgi:predicted DNA-binding transcriptional regulator AlpA
MDFFNPVEKYLSPKEVCFLLGIGLTTFWQIVRSDPTFPLGFAPRGKRRKWPLTLIIAWRETKAVSAREHRCCYRPNDPQ